MTNSLNKRYLLLSMVDYSLLSFVLRGKRRKKIFLCMDEPKTPNKVARECDVSIHNVSKSLKQLSDKDLIKCENPEDKFYRFYSLTDKGEDLMREIEKRGDK